MTTTTRAWKDPVFRMSLAEKAPAHPSGSIELDDTMVTNIRGSAIGAATVTRDKSQTAQICSITSC